MPDTILVVEDHLAVRQSLCKWFKVVFPHHRVLDVASGEEAIGVAQSELPCVVVMDLDLPGMNGIEAARHIKVAAPMAQVVILTIYDSEAHRLDAASAGVSAYMLKEEMGTALVPTLQALLADQIEAILEPQ